MAPITVDEFRARIDANQVACKVPSCSYKGHSLIAHLKQKHDLSAAQYKNTYGEIALVSPIISELNRRLDRRAQNTDELDIHLKLFTFGETEDNLLAETGKKFVHDPKFDELIPGVDKYFQTTKAAKLIAFAVATSKNLFIQGPTGSGKTMEVLHCHAKMRRPIQRVNMQGDVTVANFLGEPKANAQGTFYSYGALPLAMRAGITLLVDEVDFTPPHIGAILHPVLEGKRSLYIPWTNEQITAKEGFTVIATANTGGKGDTTGVYTGTEVLNTAFLDRFPLKLNVDYLVPDAEEAMLTRRYPGQKVEALRLLIKIAGEIRSAFKQNTLSLTMSTRKLVDFFDFTTAGMTQQDALDVTLMNWLDADDRVTVEQVVDRCGWKQMFPQVKKV